MIPPFFVPWATGRERGRHDRRGGRDRPSQRLSERRRQAHSVRGGSLLILPELTAAERRREARGRTGCGGEDRGSQRPSDCLVSDRHRPNSRTSSETGNADPLRGSQRHSERSAEPRSTRRPTDRGGAGRQIRAGPRLSGAGRSGSVRGSLTAIRRGDAVQGFGLYTTQLSAVAG